MEKIKIVSDSAGDMPGTDLKQYNIDMMCIPIAVDGKSCLERKSFTAREFYTVLNSSREIPVTSRISTDEYLRCYRRAMEHGYTHLINVTINAGGSGTYESACAAVELLYREDAAAREKLRVHVVDSRCYSAAYGWAVVEAARMAAAGEACGDIVAWLEDWFDHVEILLAMYTLDYAKHSGRIGAATAFVGDMLGLRPIILMKDGYTKTVDRVRGEKNLVPHLMALYRERRAGPRAPVIVVRGEPDEPAAELARLMEAEIGRRAPMYLAGASIAINAGPRLIALVYRGRREARE